MTESEHEIFRLKTRERIEAYLLSLGASFDFITESDVAAVREQMARFDFVIVLDDDDDIISLFNYSGPESPGGKPCAGSAGDPPVYAPGSREELERRNLLELEKWQRKLAAFSGDPEKPEGD